MGETISSGQTSGLSSSGVNFTVDSGGTLVVSSGGTALSATVAGVEEVLSGGLDSSGTILSGGTLEISAGGIATGVTDSAGATITVAAGGQFLDASLQSGATLTVSAGMVDNATHVSSGAAELVTSGGIASDSYVFAGGTETVFAGGTAAVTSVGEELYYYSSGVNSAVSSSLLQGGTLIVSSGGVASGIVVFSGGVETVLAGGTASHISLGGVTRYPTGLDSFGSTGVSGGDLMVSSGGTASGVLISAGGVETVLSSGTDFGMTVLSGGSAVVDSGAVVSAPTIAAGGVFVIEPGGTVSGDIPFAGSGAVLVISGTIMPTAILTGFDSTGPNDIIDLAGVPFDSNGSATMDSATNVLTVSEGGHSYVLDFSTSQAFSGTVWQLAPDGSGGTDVFESGTVLFCYAEGTRLATPSGEAPVENLRAGDAVLALDGAAWVARKVRWVGQFSVDLARHPQPEKAAPVRIRAHAFAPNMPHRDLLLSPEHALFIEGALIPAYMLCNGATVTQEFPPRVTYWHVELDTHAVLLAEGLPAESFLDTGLRALFAGEAGARPLHPDLVNAIAWDERACAPLILGGARIAAAHARLLARASALGWQSTEDAALSVLADGAPIALDAQGRVRLAAGTRDIRLCSRSFVPAWRGAAVDRRRLGVAVTSLRLGGRKLPARASGRGWHAPEPGLRWTDGDAHLALPKLPRPATLAIATTAAGGRYWAAPAAGDAPARAARARALSPCAG